jgi:hypothetical protein
MSVFIETGLNVTVQLCTELKISFDYGTDNCNPICPGINSEKSHANKGLCAYPAN